MSQIADALALAWELMPDGVLALLGLAVVAPWIGSLLVVRRLALLGLALPQVAGAGVALAFFLFALMNGPFEAAGFDLPEPSFPEKIAVVAGVLILVLGALAWLGKGGRSISTSAGVAFLAALAAQELLYLESPYHHAFEDEIHHGRLLTVSPSGRNLVLVAAGLSLTALVGFRRSLLLAAVDPEACRLSGRSPGALLLLTLGLLAIPSVLVVPVTGPQAVLVLLLIPPAVLQRHAPGLVWLGPLGSLAGVIGSVLGLALACHPDFDWPPAPALTAAVLLTSLVIAGILASFRSLRGRLRIQ